jgi:hypothetical protein
MFESASKEAVEIELQAEVKKLLKKQCPVFKTKCLGIACMSFCPGSVNLYKERTANSIPYVYEDWYKLREPSCSSPFVTGYIEAEMLQP